MNDVLSIRVKELVSGLLWYDRKEDEYLPRGEIEKMIASGETTVDDIVSEFRSELDKHLSPANQPPST